MILTYDEIKKITLGAVDIKLNGDEFKFFRMASAQTDAFAREKPEYKNKTYATSGIRFDFITDARYLNIKIGRMENASSRSFGGFDVLVDGVLYMHIFADNVNEQPITDISVQLFGKECRVQVFFPNLATATLKRVEISDGAVIKPVSPKLRIQCYGDSITQGYDAYYSSRSYVNILARKLDAEVFDQAIGGAKFNSEVIHNLDHTPDIVTVAYGTNDWSGRDYDTFVGEADKFLKKLKEVYCGTKVFIILPIWRADWDTKTESCGFYEGRGIIAKIAAECGFEIIDDINLVPHDARMFSDLYLHPNDEGFELYGKTLAGYIQQKL